MTVFQLNLRDKKQVRDFLNLPFRLYRHNPCWVPPLEMDMKAALNPQKHPFYRHSEAAFFLAYAPSGLPLGRLAVINNRRYNDYNNDRAAFFYWFECEDDLDSARDLFTAAFDWARARGLTKMIGPKGFTPLDGAGLLVEGFQYRPAFGMPYTLPYYPQLVEHVGFRPHRETVSGYLRRETAQFPERVHELAERVAARRGLRVRTFRKRRELRDLTSIIKELYNASLSGTRENYPLTDDDVAGMANLLLLFADPALVKLVMKDERVVGFLLAYPDISAAIQKTKGRLFPFGWLTLLIELRRTDWVNLNGIGLVEEYRGLGGTAILASEIAKSLVDHPRYRVADVVQIGTENENMQREIKNFGVDFCKRHRVYIREL